MALDAQTTDALAAQVFVIAPLGHFIETDAAITSWRQAPRAGDARRYLGWCLRNLGHLRESLDETEAAYRLDGPDPISANLLSLARMASGRVADAIPIFEELVERMPTMSFPMSSLLRTGLAVQVVLQGRQSAANDKIDR